MPMWNSRPCAGRELGASGLRAGFTLAELLIGALAASIVALAAGSMLYVLLANWQRDSRDVGLQRDATAALALLHRVVRQASNVVVGAESVTLVTPDGTASFRRDGADALVYTPVGGGDVTIIAAGRVSAFTPAFGARRLTLQFRLQDGDRLVEMQNIMIHTRNVP